MLLTFISLLLDSGVTPPGTGPYPYFSAIQNGLTSALTVCLLINGFVGFQLYEDGTHISVWMLRCISLAMFAVTFLVSLATYFSWAGLGPTSTIGLFIVLYLISAIELAIYGVMQVILVVNTLQDRWPLGELAFAAFFFIAGQVLLYAFSEQICNGIQHYLDGLFFATITNLLAVMMIYKVCLLSFHDIARIFITNAINSTGIPLPKKISSSLSASSKTTGKSRSSSPKTSGEIPFTKTRIIRIVRTCDQGIRITEVSTTRLLGAREACMKRGGSNGGRLS
ncbi:Chitin synthase, class 7 [Clarireedia jacksonii]